MLYKFKSKASGDVIMLQAGAERILQIIGKPAQPQGIILPDQMPAALAALEAAIAQGVSGAGAAAQDSADDDKDTAPTDRVTLRQRARPFIDMLRRCHAADREIVWGV